MILYNFVIRSYQFLTNFAAFCGYRKATKLANCRNIPIHKIHSKNVFWIHAASAGEGNQAIPLAQELKKNQNAYVLISFFSPSGYEYHQNSKHFDSVICLPVDKLSKMESLISSIQPKTVIFIRRELWWNLLSLLHKKGIPFFLINAYEKVIHPSNAIINYYNQKCLRLFKKIYTSYKIPASISPLNISSIVGDTKSEAARKALANSEENIISEFAGNNKCVIIGSSWPSEELLLANWIRDHDASNLKIIIAPHDLSKQRINEIQKIFPQSIAYSNIGKQKTNQVLILDQIGILKTAYKYCTVAIVGGGFKKGLHNILEPIACDKPVIIGPNFKKFPEAVELVNDQLAFSVSQQLEFNDVINRLLIDSEINMITKKIKHFNAQSKDISSLIIDDILKQVNP